MLANKCVWTRTSRLGTCYRVCNGTGEKRARMTANTAQSRKWLNVNRPIPISGGVWVRDYSLPQVTPSESLHLYCISYAREYYIFIMCAIYIVQDICYWSSLNKNVPLLHTQWGQTAVYTGSWNGHSEVVKLLVQAGADLELQREVY